MKAPDLLRAIRRGKSKCVTLFYGDEPWFADQAVEALCNTWLEGDRNGLETVDGRKSPNDTIGVSIGEVIDDIRTAPMFATRKLIFLRARAAFDKEELAALVSVAKAAPTHARLVIAMRALSSGNSQKLTRAGAAVGVAKKLFEKPWPGKPEAQSALNVWLVQRAAEHGLRLQGLNAVLLSRAIGNDLGALDAALLDLGKTAGPGREITEEAIRELTGRGRDFDAFEFGEAIYDRDASRAMRVARSAFVEGVVDRDGKRSQSDAGAAARLLWSARFVLDGVYRARSVLDEGHTGRGAVKAMGPGNPAATERSLGRATQFTLAELREHYRILLGVDGAIRRGLPQEPVIARLIVDLTGAAHGG